MKAALLLEENRLERTFWGKRIIDAEARGSFNREDEKLADNWTTCACGRQDDCIPRDIDGAPLDSRLEELGMRFGDIIEGSKAFVATTKTLIAIEKRAKEVLKTLPKESA